MNYISIYIMFKDQSIYKRCFKTFCVQTWIIRDSPLKYISWFSSLVEGHCDS